MENERKPGTMRVSLIVNTLFSFFNVAEWCCGKIQFFRPEPIHWRFSKELNQGSVDFKSLSPPTKEMRESKGM